MPEQSIIQVLPATAERWSDLESLFGTHGAYAGCWCMFWRLNRADFNRLKGDGAKAVLHSMTCKNRVPGLLAYVNGQAAGWCSIGPREHYKALEASRILKRVDDQPVWSIVCFFVTKPFRRQGLMLELLRGAVEYARQQGAQVVESYPIDMQSSRLAGKRLNSSSGYMGIASVFSKIGFVEVGRASETQLIMRSYITNGNG